VVHEMYILVRKTLIQQDSQEPPVPAFGSGCADVLVLYIYSLVEVHLLLFPAPSLPAPAPANTLWEAALGGGGKGGRGEWESWEAVPC